MEGCFASNTIPFDSLYRTQGSCASGFTDLGEFDLTCTNADGNQWIDATITPSVDIVVIMKGGNGGVVYSLAADQPKTLDVGVNKGISHIEFCFICDGCDPTASPSEAPSVGWN